MIRVMNNVYGKTILESSGFNMKQFILMYLIFGCINALIFYILCLNAPEVKDE